MICLLQKLENLIIIRSLTGQNQSVGQRFGKSDLDFSFVSECTPVTFVTTLSIKVLLLFIVDTCENYFFSDWDKHDEMRIILSTRQVYRPYCL